MCGLRFHVFETNVSRVLVHTGAMGVTDRKLFEQPITRFLYFFFITFDETKKVVDTALSIID